MDETPEMREEARPVAYGTGVIALDIVFPAEVGGTVAAWAGGTCGNVLAILAYLGWEAHPIARLNGDSPSEWVREDLRRWGVRLDLADLSPTASTPVIIQYIRRTPTGGATHRFSWACPDCGASLPRYRAVTAGAAEEAASRLRSPSVFFLDRVSRGSLILAAASASLGAVVVFEPTGIGDPKLFREALSLADVVKYSSDRLADGLPGLDDLERTPRLVIETQGRGGLRYRADVRGRGPRGWRDLPAFEAPVVRDSAGSGDWCTAALLHQLAGNGIAGLETVTQELLADALRYGQAAAAWNCSFEGARGGMYRTDRPVFDAAVDRILGGYEAEAHGPTPPPAPAAMAPVQGFCAACTV
ncbi:MAG TPA: hypothetical protein VFQ76_12320 [Longimicrobiaceae bacterium]|nr:hypothetical protein [Longimicrobiaceae bacterium]